MAYDEDVADRIRMRVAREPGLSEQKMFGGLAFLIGGHMAVSAGGRGGLLLRCDPSDTEAHIAHPDATRFVMRGREMDGWLHIAPAGIESDDDLARWVAVGVAYARALPPK